MTAREAILAGQRRHDDAAKYSPFSSSMSLRTALAPARSKNWRLVKLADPYSAASGRATFRVQCSRRQRRRGDEAPLVTNMSLRSAGRIGRRAVSVTWSLAPALIRRWIRTMRPGRKGLNVRCPWQRRLRTPERCDVVVNLFFARDLEEHDTALSSVSDRLEPEARPPFKGSRDRP